MQEWSETTICVRTGGVHAFARVAVEVELHRNAFRNRRIGLEDG